MERPEKISKLAYYLMDKEPLFYLFIINTDFIKENNILSEYAGVGYKNGRVKFLYTDKFLELPIKKIYFVLVHEAYHVFKKHLSIHEDLQKKNPLLVNIAEDAIINTEIKGSKFIGIKPEWDGLEPIFVPDEYTRQYHTLGKDAYVTPRLFNWYLQSKDIDKKELLEKNKHVKDTKTGEYARIEYRDSDETFSISVYKEGLQGIFDEINGNYNLSRFSHNRQKVSVDDLIPVFVNSQNQSYQQAQYDGDYESYGFSDDHSQMEESDEPEPISQQVFTQKIIRQAREMTENNPQLKKQMAGKERGNSILEKLEGLIKPEVSWKKIFKKRINLYYSNNSISKRKKKSVLTYLMNAKSRYGMIFKHWMKVKDKLQRYVFVAVDTSGSCFSDQYDMERFFSEIDAIAEQLEFSNTGRVFVMQWDWSVTSDFKEYHKGDWKTWKMQGGGGTNPRCIFSHVGYKAKPVGTSSVAFQIDEAKKDSMLFIPDKNKMPMMIVLTDGYFYGRMSKSDLGLWESNSQNVLFVTKSTDSLYDGAKAITFK